MELEKYYFKTKGREPDIDCTERCMVKDSGIMIGSVSCQECIFNKGNNASDDSWDGDTWIKCERLAEAIKK